jgi:hypothetical protein
MMARSRVSVVGPEIIGQDIGLIFQLANPPDRTMGGALIDLREFATGLRAHEKWFGGDCRRR